VDEWKPLPTAASALTCSSAVIRTSTQGPADIARRVTRYDRDIDMGYRYGISDINGISIEILI